jgi:dUTP pyrophosphatase
MIDIKIKKLHPNSVIPQYAKVGDAGMDLTAVEILENSDLHITYDIGLAVEIPEGFVGLIFPRSSIKHKNLSLSNSVGVIDSGYRGNLQATFNKIETFDNIKHWYAVGDRVAQMIIIPYPQINFVEVEELSDTERGTGGFGSSGK